MIRCIKLHRYEKNTLRAFVDLELSHAGLVLCDCTVHEKNGQEWISFPAATRWQPLIEVGAGAKQARAQFQCQAIAAINIFTEQVLGPAS
jgi:hypothetical protein